MHMIGEIPNYRSRKRNRRREKRGTCLVGKMGVNNQFNSQSPALQRSC